MGWGSKGCLEALAALADHAKMARGCAHAQKRCQLPLVGSLCRWPPGTVRATSRRAGVCFPGFSTYCTRQAPWPWTLLQFQLEDSSFETPLGSDASQFPFGLEPGGTCIRACPGLPLEFAPLKLGLGSVAWVPVSLPLTGGEGICKSAQAAAPVPVFLCTSPQA